MMEALTPFGSTDVLAAFPEYNIDVVPLGRGAMKSAFQILGADPRVLKIVHEPLPEEEHEGQLSFLERIRREIEGMRAINHPSIVSILDGPEIRRVGNRRHVWYIEPFFSGGTLADRLTNPWPEAEVLNLLDGLVDGAEALANHNTVHRDIKPANIVFNSSGKPVLLDLGIAYFQELTDLTEGLAQSPMTPTYAAPEQFNA